MIAHEKTERFSLGEKVRWGDQTIKIDSSALGKKNYNFEDLRGCVFGRWVVTKNVGYKNTKPKVNHWQCICLCGGEKVVNTTSLKSGDSSSCGCYRLDRVRRVTTTHGDNRSKEHHLWIGMKSRCNSNSVKAKIAYRDRGINVCERWHKYENFLADLGRLPEGKESIDRIDNNGGYWCGKPECSDCGPLHRKPNCRWATREEQAWNMQQTIQVTANGVTANLKYWSSVTGLSLVCLRARRDYGWTDDEIINTPFRQSPKRG